MVDPLDEVQANRAIKQSPLPTQPAKSPDMEDQAQFTSEEALKRVVATDAGSQAQDVVTTTWREGMERFASQKDTSLRISFLVNRENREVRFLVKNAESGEIIRIVPPSDVLAVTQEAMERVIEELERGLGGESHEQDTE